MTRTHSKPHSHRVKEPVRKPPKLLDLRRILMQEIRITQVNEKLARLGPALPGVLRRKGVFGRAFRLSAFVAALAVSWARPALCAGGHEGELKDLTVRVVYLNPPGGYRSDGRPVYYIGQPMELEVRIRNGSPRTYPHLDITAFHQYYETHSCDRWWYPHPREVSVSKGDPLPGASSQTWTDQTIGGEQELVLRGTYTAPLEICDGLDQTGVRIKHSNQGADDAGLMYHEPEVGVFCPPPPK